jgi:hypothetical protein
MVQRGPITARAGGRPWPCPCEVDFTTMKNARVIGSWKEGNAWSCEGETWPHWRPHLVGDVKNGEHLLSETIGSKWKHPKISCVLQVAKGPQSFRAQVTRHLWHGDPGFKAFPVGVWSCFGLILSCSSSIHPLGMGMFTLCYCILKNITLYWFYVAGS